MGTRTVEIAVRDAAGALFPGTGPILIAVSGGGDSIALMHLLERRFRGRRMLRVAHLDHALRRGSAADRRFVEHEAAAIGLETLSDRRSVETLRRRDESPEEAARRVRRSFLLEAAASTGANHVALGHTLDDQAETILFRWLRGGGPTSLTGMATSGPGPFRRPLLRLERKELRGWLEARDVPFREDPTNRDVRFDRNRLRLRVLPLLERWANPRAGRHIVAAAERLRRDAEFLDTLADRRLRRWTSPSRRQGRVEVDAERLGAAADPIGRRVALSALERAGVDPRRVTSRHVEAVVDLARGAAGRSVALPSGRRAVRTRHAVVIDTVSRRR